MEEQKEIKVVGKMIILDKGIIECPNEELADVYYKIPSDQPEFKELHKRMKKLFGSGHVCVDPSGKYLMKYLKDEDVFEYKLAEFKTIDFFKNQVDGTLIGKLEGIVVFLDKFFKDSKFVKEGETWKCGIKSMDKKFGIVFPVERTKNKQQNEKELIASLSQLESKFKVKKGK